MRPKICWQANASSTLTVCLTKRQPSYVVKPSPVSKMPISDHEIIHNAIQLVNEGMRVTFPVKGNSMLPFIIGGKESVDLVKPDNLQVGDVVLAWVDGCRYVVHRIIHIDGDRVMLQGDGNIVGTEACSIDEVAAKAMAVVSAKGTHHDLYSPWRLRAARLWFRLRPVRRWILAVYKRAWLKIELFKR